MSDGKKPFHYEIETVLRRLQNWDRRRIFWYPVNRTYVPDYYDIIKSPMDISTMRKKLGNCEYSTLEDVKMDFVQMCRNAMVYNGRRYGILQNG